MGDQIITSAVEPVAYRSAGQDMQEPAFQDYYSINRLSGRDCEGRSTADSRHGLSPQCCGAPGVSSAPIFLDTRASAWPSKANRFANNNRSTRIISAQLVRLR
jgi:hypothetical protein